jgi:hypothetical protein
MSRIALSVILVAIRAISSPCPYFDQQHPGTRAGLSIGDRLPPEAQA